MLVKFPKFELHFQCIFVSYFRIFIFLTVRQNKNPLMKIPFKVRDQTVGIFLSKGFLSLFSPCLYVSPENILAYKVLFCMQWGNQFPSFVVSRHDFLLANRAQELKIKYKFQIIISQRLFFLSWMKLCKIFCIILG